MEPIVIFEVLLLVAIVAGIFSPWDARSGKERRRSNRGGRRQSDGMQAQISDEPASQQ